MADKRRIAANSARVLTGVLGTALFLGAALAVGQADIPVLAVDAPKTTVTPTAADQFRVCPGPLLRQGGDASAGSFAQAAVTSAVSSTPEQAALVAPNNTTGDRFGAPTVLSVHGAEGERPQIGAAQSQEADLDDLTGFAATACGEVSADSWLVGGSTDVGRTTMLSLSNPNRADAVIDLSFFGETGTIEAPGAKGIVVPAGENRLLSVASFAPGVRTPVIRVQSTGGQVVAALQHSVTRGITPEGIELSLPTAAPSTNQALAGVVIADSAPAPEGEIYDDSVAALRLFVPGTEQAQVDISFVSEQGSPVPAPLSYPIQGGAVQEVNLNVLAAGSYSVNISSDLPLVASARTTAIPGESSDFAWFGASAPLDDDIELAVAEGEGARLHVFNPTGSDLEVVLTDRAGAATQLAVPAGAAVASAVSAGTAYSVRGVEGAHAQVTFDSTEGISAYPISPSNPLATPVTVYPR